MIRYILYKKERNTLFYKYFVEDSEDFGIVSIDKGTGLFEIVKESVEDTSRKFAFKLVRKLQKFFTSNNFKNDGIIAWY